MSVDSITGAAVAYQVQTSKPAGSNDRPVKRAPVTEGQPDNQPLKAGAVSANLNTVADDSMLKHKQPQAGSEPAGVVSHVVVSYNQQGKLRTKFEDSRNNVVYQLPSEMTAKLEDRLLSSNSSTDIKA